MSQLEKIRKPINREMHEFGNHFRQSMQSDIPLLNLITNYLRRGKGKQLRPLMVFLSAGLCGKTSPSTYTAATLIELLHTATLIHDDVVDDSYERRGMFSIKALWRSKISVLLGDYLLSRGLLLSVEEHEYELLELVSVAVREMSEGELQQIQKSRKLNIDKEEYFEIIRKKTATLLAACAACGAWSSSRDRDVTEKLRLFGEKLGMAFQIKDDLFDYQQKGLIGKPTGNDIKEKKFTLPLIHALESCPPKDRKNVIRYIRKNNQNAAAVRKVIDFVIQYEGITYSTQQMYSYRDEALNILKEFPDNEYKTSLILLTDYIVERRK